MGFWRDIKQDYTAVFERDPAARNRLEVILAYPGVQAIFVHRVIHMLWHAGIPVIPRLLSYIMRFITGIEIHPAAKIGPGFVIDHGMGVVIGETAEVGRNCLLYQGVTLGGTGKEKGKRHPTLGNNVTVGAGAKILGAITIGSDAVIGANSVILKPVPDNAICVGVPGRITKKKIIRMTTEDGLVEVMDYFPDPTNEKIKELEARILEISRKMEAPRSTESPLQKGGRMKLFNTLSGKKEDFIPVMPEQVLMYVCGITVYDHCHIGHARSAIVFDSMRRYLAYRGYKVTFVKNFTDIDDKIINRARQEGIAWNEVAEKYIKEYYQDMDQLGVGRADVEPKATEHIQEIIDITKGLLDKGYAYAVGGDVYFQVEKFADYGKLSRRDLDDMIAGARVDVNEKKRNPMDFALWKASKEGEPSWTSPWGPGRPGWHIECSAMSRKHLGDTFDIHGGGADLAFPHHENEIAQSEAYTGKPFAKYWVHNGFITVDKEKMSKSLGNFFTIKDILAKFDAEAVRFFLLSAHYRSPIEFSDEQLRESEVSIDRYYTTSTRIRDFIGQDQTREKAGVDEKAFEELSGRFIDRVKEAMDDDFNTALAIGHIFEFLRGLNKYMDGKPSGVRAMALVKKADELLKEAGSILNIFCRTPEQWNWAVMRYKCPDITEEFISVKIQERQKAREDENWAAADTIRKELDEKGVALEDKKDGTVWKVKIS